MKVYYIGFLDKPKNNEIREFVGLVLNCNSKEIKKFKSGDFIKDWFNCIKYLNELSVDGMFPMVTTSSQLNHLGDYGFDFESGYLHEENGKYILKYFDRTKENWFEDVGIDNSFEFFVPNNTWTWEQLVNYCK